MTYRDIIYGELLDQKGEMGMQINATTMGIIAVVLAIGSLFLCAPLAPLVAIAAIVFSIIAIRGGAKGWGIAALIIAGFTMIYSVVAMYQAQQHIERGLKQMQQGLEQMQQELQRFNP
jgi:uncharacterized membrane protein